MYKKFLQEITYFHKLLLSSKAIHQVKLSLFHPKQKFFDHHWPTLQLLEKISRAIALARARKRANILPRGWFPRGAAWNCKHSGGVRRDETFAVFRAVKFGGRGTCKPISLSARRSPEHDLCLRQVGRWHEGEGRARCWRKERTRERGREGEERSRSARFLESTRSAGFVVRDFAIR